MRGRNSKEQQETVAGVLAGLLPPQAPERFRQWFPLNKVTLTPLLTRVFACK
jgi:hypothetical protein